MIWKDRSDSASIIRENPRDKPVWNPRDPWSRKSASFHFGRKRKIHISWRLLRPKHSPKRPKHWFICEWKSYRVKHIKKSHFICLSDWFSALNKLPKLREEISQNLPHKYSCLCREKSAVSLPLLNREWCNISRHLSMQRCLMKRTVSRDKHPF